MGFINADGMNISFECSELIQELKEDIADFGGDTIVAVWTREEHGVMIYTNYDFICEEEPLSKTEVKQGEKIVQMTMSALLILLEEQNKII